MLTVQDSTTAILLCVITMLGWGSWANTQKLAGKSHWPFQLYYWDYAWGVFLFSLLFAFTAGSIGGQGQPALSNFHTASASAIGSALLSGALFNLANVLLVAAIDAAGMTVAFPLGIGLALVIGTITTYRQTPRGNPALLFAGVLFVVVAMLCSAAASARLPGQTKSASLRGIALSIAAGSLMGLFYPQLIAAISPDFHRLPIAPGMLTPYTAAVFFAVGLLLSNIVINTIFMRLSDLTYRHYFAGSARLHGIGVLGGVIWMLALCVNILASSSAGPAISYALGQGATLVAAIWGVFIWREFRSAPSSTYTLIGAMFASYVVGLVLVGMAVLRP